MRKISARLPAVVAVLVWTGIPAPGADSVGAPPKELVQYVSASKRSGVKEDVIRREAVNAGWPPDVVDEAIASLGGQPKEPTPGPSPKQPTSESPVSRPPVRAPIPGTEVSASPVAAVPPSPPAPGVPAPATERIDKLPDAKDRGVPDDYRIGAGDILQITVWKDPDASVPSAIVRPDGKITIPLIKEVEVVGLTPTAAEKTITERLDKVIQGVDVTVIVKDIQSKKIYVIGAVKKEGTLQYTYRMSVMQALTEAGGLTDYAKRKKIYILRNEGGKDYRLPFDYDAVIKGQKMEQNIQLLAGDTIVVPH